MKPILKVALAARRPCRRGRRRQRADQTLDTVKSRGMVNCGVGTGTPGFSAPDDKGNWTGLDVDFCRAVAAAVFGDASKVSFKPLTAKERFTALQSGEVDMLSRTTTWTMSRDSAMGLSFAGIMYYRRPGADGAQEARREIGQGAQRRFRVRGDRHHHRAQPRRLLPHQQHDLQAGGVREGRRGQRRLRCRPLRCLHHRPVEPLCAAPAPAQAPTTTSCCPRSSPRSRWARRCARATSSGSRSTSGSTSRCSMPRSSAYEQERRRDAQVDQPRHQAPARHRGRVRQGPSASTTTGSCKIVKGVGNYGEIFERNVGPDTPLKIARGLNNLWNKGGIQYAPPIR